MAKKSIGAILTIKDNDFRTKMRRSTRGFEDFRRSSRKAATDMAFFENAVRNAGSRVGDLGKTLVGAAAAYAGISSASGLFGRMISEASSLEGYRNTLEVVMKDTQKAAETMRWAVDFANRTPFETGSIVEATVRLQSYGLEAKKILPAIGDMAGVMNTDIMQAVEAVADAQTGELERLKEYGITKQMIVDHAAKIMRGHMIVNNKGQIVDQERFNKALFSLMEERFKGGMERQAKTFKGVMSTVSGIYKTALAEIAGISADGTIKAGSFFDTVKTKALQVSDVLQRWQSEGTFTRWSEGLAAAINEIPNAINFLKDTITAFTPVLAGLTAAYATHKAVVIATTVAQRAHNIATIASNALLTIQCAWLEYQTAAALTGSRAIGIIRAAQWAWNAAMAANPIGAVIVAVAGLAAGIYVLVKNFDKVTAAIKRAWGWLSKWFKAKGTNIEVGTASMGDFRQIEGSHASGLAYVPHDNYIAELHRGERVLTAAENRQYNETINNNGRNNITIYINAQDKSARQIMNELIPELKLALANM